MEDDFDIIAHAGLSFVEMMSTNFLNLIESPRNLLQQQQLERNAAFLVTIPILHNLFIACNDIIDMQWLEKQAALTGETKRDGVAFVIKNRVVTPHFVELSGGIDFNANSAKESVDEKKMMRQLVKLLKFKAEESEDPIQYYIRYYDLKLYFESLAFGMPNNSKGASRVPEENS
ncbi:hypothetical protein RMATCC62417_15073 [Rhizopus microsporus]|nr:hypothetical protein RMATCC62417_15073 [Rhizopus microsporus]